jgi:transposase-like protein
MYTRKIMEYMAYLYLRSLSFQQVRAIVSAWFEASVITKDVLLEAIEEVADALPKSGEITAWLKPVRSGYYAWDGTWLTYRGEEFVLLILLDVITLDVVAYAVAADETYESYQKLLRTVQEEIAQPKGFFCDGEPGLLKLLKEQYPSVPTQLCVFHKYSRVGQIACFVHPKSDLDREIKRRVEKVLFAPTRSGAIAALAELMQYANDCPKNKKLKQVIGVLKRNFELLLTHYDNPEMSPYNNVLEGFNYLIKRRTRLMKGFKKPINISRWLKLLILDWRFHTLTESEWLCCTNPPIIVPYEGTPR